MENRTSATPARVIALDLLSLVGLAATAGVVAGVAFGCVAVLFASQAQPPASLRPDAAPRLERPSAATPPGAQPLPPAVPLHPAPRDLRRAA